MTLRRVTFSLLSLIASAAWLFAPLAASTALPPLDHAPTIVENPLPDDVLLPLPDELGRVDILGNVILDAVSDYRIDPSGEAYETHAPDVVLTDILMPPHQTDEGIRAATTLRETHPQTGVVVLSQYGHPSYALALLENGSDRRAYLLKQRVHERAELVRAIRSVADGGSVIGSNLPRLFNRTAPDAPLPAPTIKSSKPSRFRSMTASAGPERSNCLIRLGCRAKSSKLISWCA